MHFTKLPTWWLSRNIKQGRWVGKEICHLLCWKLRRKWAPDASRHLVTNNWKWRHASTWLVNQTFTCSPRRSVERGKYNRCHHVTVPEMIFSPWREIIFLGPFQEQTWTLSQPSVELLCRGLFLYKERSNRGNLTGVYSKQHCFGSRQPADHSPRFQYYSTVVI